MTLCVCVRVRVHVCVCVCVASCTYMNLWLERESRRMHINTQNNNSVLLTAVTNQ